MACSQTLSGIPRDCESNAGGLKAVYIANYDDVTAVTLDSTGGSISGITMASSAKFKAFYFKPGQASLTLTGVFNEAAEYAGEDGILAMQFGRMDTTKRVQVAAVSVGELVVIVKDNNGKNWLLGKDAPVLRNGGESAFGAQKSDFNHYGVQLHSVDNQLPYEVSDTILEGIIG